MDEEARLIRELERLERLDREMQFDAEVAEENCEMDMELLVERVRAARLAGA
ncbi:MAG TPA: hypothetical protein VFC18_19320 [Burkholderiales bacterium]|nr:hypothetical protein [Burkholderiales bacterium]